MKKNYVAIGIIVLILIAGAVTYLEFGKKAGVEPVKTNEAKNPSFFLGNLIMINGDKLTFKEGNEEKVVIFGNTTQLVKQVKDGKTGLKNVGATISDFKFNSQIAVYYLEPPVGAVYKAVKLQIIN